MNDAVDPTTRDRAVAAARGHAPFDLLLTGGTVIDVGSLRTFASDVGIVGPMIASVHPSGSRSDAATTLDVTGKYVAPGFIDMHVHFESSMLTPAGYASAISPRGTTTVFADPHELANAAGLDGVRYAIDASRELPVRFIIQAPSCVPPMPGLELSAYDIEGGDVTEMLDWPAVGGVAEVMDMLGVLDRSERMVDVVGAGLESGKLVSGHAWGLSGPALQGYLAAGIGSDHEIIRDTDAIEKLRAGMTVELRGAFDDLLEPLVAELLTMPMIPTHLVACTDDLFAATLLDSGGIDHLLVRLVRAGLDPLAAIRLATYNAAYRLQRSDLGFVGPGRRADLAILSDLPGMVVDDVIFDGRHVASGGAMLEPVVVPACNPPLRTVLVPRFTADDFVLRLRGVPDGPVDVRTVHGVIHTSWAITTVVVRDGAVEELPDGVLVQAAVHRYGRREPTPVIGLLTGWGEWTGAIATTVAHDTHNLVVFGRDPADMAVAANAAADAGGGIVVVRGGTVLSMIELPIAGLLSPLPPHELAEVQRATTEAALGVATLARMSQPLFQVATSSLACLPGPHVTDVGLIDGSAGVLVDSILA